MLRGRYLAERASLSAEEKQAIDRGIAQNILQSEFYQQADCIFCYVSTAEEIDTRTVLENALASGRTVCVPLCGKGGSMTARKITALSEAADRSLRYPGAVRHGARDCTREHRSDSCACALVRQKRVPSRLRRRLL